MTVLEHGKPRNASLQKYFSTHLLNIYMHTYYIHIHTHLCTTICMYIYIYIHIRICMYAGRYVGVGVCVCVCACVYVVYMYTHISVHIYIHMYAPPILFLRHAHVPTWSTEKVGGRRGGSRQDQRPGQPREPWQGGALLGSARL